jgi:hypothetical protein
MADESMRLGIDQRSTDMSTAITITAFEFELIHYQRYGRAAEFVDRPLPRDALMALWEERWRRLHSALDLLSDDELRRMITVHMAPDRVTLALATADPPRSTSGGASRAIKVL